jgi:hypothetical protein
MENINSNNTSSHKGVSYHKKSGKWQATMSIEGKSKSLGIYDKIEDAIEARQKALNVKLLK